MLCWTGSPLSYTYNYCRRIHSTLNTPCSSKLKMLRVHKSKFYCYLNLTWRRKSTCMPVIKLYSVFAASYCNWSTFGVEHCVPIGYALTMCTVLNLWSISYIGYTDFSLKQSFTTSSMYENNFILLDRALADLQNTVYSIVHQLSMTDP